jgi:hypothetical protein
MRGVDIVEVWNMEGDEGRATLNAGELIFYKKNYCKQILFQVFECQSNSKFSA